MGGGGGARPRNVPTKLYVPMLRERAVLESFLGGGGLLGAWRICARELCDRAGGGCGRAEPPPTVGTF